MALLATAVRRAVMDSDATPADKATAELAIAYARHIDEGGDVNKTGPLLLAVLDSLLMTPRARAASVKGGARGGRASNPLDELRQRRATRVNNPAAVDTPAAGADA